MKKLIVSLAIGMMLGYGVAESGSQWTELRTGIWVDAPTGVEYIIYYNTNKWTTTRSHVTSVMDADIESIVAITPRLRPDGTPKNYWDKED